MTPEQMRDASLLELFSLEADAQTQVLNAGLLALERNPTQADQLEACMRAAHSLKGAARIVGVDAGVSVAHVMEDCLVSAQERRLYLQPEHIDALLQGTDLLMRIATPGNDVGPADIQAYVALMERLLDKPIHHRGYAECSNPAIRLGNVHSAHRPWQVPILQQCRLHTWPVHHQPVLQFLNRQAINAWRASVLQDALVRSSHVAGFDHLLHEPVALRFR